MNFDRSLDVPYGVEVRLSPRVARLLAPNPGPVPFKGTGVYIVGDGASVAVVDPGPKGPMVVEAGVIRPGSGCRALGQRLDYIYRNLQELLAAYPPGALALEQVHSHIKFPRTAILMSHARGVIVLAAANRGVPVFGYAAARVKKTLTGSGKAPKEQMQRAIQTELRLEELPEPHDVADACALALCHYQVGRSLRGLKGL